MKKLRQAPKRIGRPASFTTSLTRKATAMPRAGKPVATPRVSDLQSELELLTSYSSDTIYRLRYDTMTYDYISPSITRLLGFTPGEFKRTNFRSLILETRIVTDGMKTVESFEQLEGKRRGGDVNKWEADYLIRTKDFKKIWVADVSYPWFDDNGKIIGSVGSLRDITDRINAENAVKEELARLANTDALTGLPNRREFFNTLDREIKRVQRSNSDVSVLLIDIDHFKKINDSYGHDVGDFVLVEMGKIITGCLRETDMAVRLGGEEFGVFLPDTCSEGAYFVAERIRKEVQRHVFQLGQDGKPLGCTVSIGVAATTAGEGIDSTQLYKMADTRLYIAKNTGRNQVSVDEIMLTH